MDAFVIILGVAFLGVGTAMWLLANDRKSEKSFLDRREEKQIDSPCDSSKANSPSQIQNKTVSGCLENTLTPPIVSLDPDVKFYTALEIFFATSLGSPLAGCYLLSANFRNLNKRELATKTLWIGIVSILIVGFLVNFYSENILKTITHPLFSMTYASVLYYFAWYHEKCITQHIKNGGKRYSGWRTLGIIILSLAVTFAMLFASVLTSRAWLCRTPNVSAQLKVEKKFIQRFAIAVFSVAESAPELSSRKILVKFDNGVLRFLASDGCRILIMKKEVEAKNAGDFSLVISSGLAQRLSMLDSTQEAGEIFIQDKEISFNFDDLNFSEKYQGPKALPDYDNFVPATSEIEITVDREKMLDVLKNSFQLADAYYRIELSIADDKITINSPVNPVAAPQRIDVLYKEEPISLFFDIRYLLQFFSTIATENSVDLEFSTIKEASDKSLTVRGEDYIFFLLPLRSPRPGS